MEIVSNLTGLIGFLGGLCAFIVPTSAQVRVYCNPANPQQSALER